MGQRGSFLLWLQSEEGQQDTRAGKHETAKAAEVPHLCRIPCVRIQEIPKNLKHAWYKFYFYIIKENLKSNWSRNRIIEEINLLGFPAFQGSCSELYLEKGLKSYINQEQETLDNAKLLGDTSVMLLVHHTISKLQMEQYVDAVTSILLEASR